MNEHDLNESAMKAALEDLLDAIPKSAHPKIMQAIKAKQPKQIADILKVNRVKSRFSEKEAAEMVMDYFMDYFGPLESVVEDGEITEKVDLDARTGPFRRTVDRLSYQRSMRESKLKGKKWEGLYNDGTGKGASIPEPIEFNRESRRFEKEVDGRIRAFKEAMKRVETYRKLRETKKKMIAGQKSMKEEVIIESVDEFLDDMEKAYKKGGLKAIVSTGGSSLRDEMTFMDFVENLSRYMKGVPPATMKYIKKEIAGMVKPADMPKIAKYVKETFDVIGEAITKQDAQSFLDDMEKAYKKGGLNGQVITGKGDKDTFLGFVDGLSRYMRGAAPDVMRMVKKEIAGMVKPADMPKIAKYVKETFDVAEAADMVTKAGVEMIGDAYAIAEEDLSPAQKKYRAFFQKALKKFGADSPADMDDAKKKKFFDYVKANYKESASILPPNGRTLGEEELSQEQKKYREFFKGVLKKFKASSPDKMDDATKKKFFKYVKANWKG